MTLDEYEEFGKALYADFSRKVKSVLDAVLKSNGKVRVQVIQNRAKELSEVRKKLDGKLNDIETVVKDLAGVRIVVYSNSDVERLNRSRILEENFEIDWDRTKIHYPLSSNNADESQFIGQNFVVRLKDDRVALAEYMRFAGIQCEVQVQTILDHAWSETAHDTIYKSPNLNGVGEAQMARIRERMRDIQQKYLRPAGYEFQQVLNDFEHIVSGQHLVDSDILAAIGDAQDNNVRVELLEQFATVVLPIIDDKAAAAPEIRSTLLAAARKSRSMVTTPLETPIGPLPGRTHEDVLEKIINILAVIRYFDPVDAFAAYVDLYLVFDGPDSQHKIEDAVGELAQFALPLWQSFGPSVQESLLEAIATSAISGLSGARPLMIAALGKCLEPEVTGTLSTSTSLTWETGSVVVSDRVNFLRDRALAMLKDLFNSSQSEAERTKIYRAMLSSTRFPSFGNCDDKLRERILADTADIITFFAEQRDNLSDFLKEKIENNTLFHYRRAKKKSGNELGGGIVSTARDAVVTAAMELRKSFNDDYEFVTFKTLVGFQSVFEYEWDEDEDEIDYSAKASFRKARAAEYLEQVTESTADDWFDRLNGYASTKSDDSATFQFLGSFVASVAEKSPSIAESWLDRCGGKPLAQSTPGLLRGFYTSDREAAIRWIGVAIDRHDRLSLIAQFIKHAEPAVPDLLEKVARAGIAAQDEEAAYLVLEACVTRPTEFGVPLARKLAIETLTFLRERNFSGWIEPLWMWGKKFGLLSQFDETERSALFAAIVELGEIDFRAEEILEPYCELHANEIIDLFGARLERQSSEQGNAYANARFTAIPLDFDRLHKSMQHTGPLLLPKALEWHRRDPQLGKFRSARLVANVFPELPEDAVSQLIDYAKSGDRAAQNFVIDVMSNYNGAPIVYTVLKELVAVVPVGDEILGGVRVAFGETGVMYGEFGLRNAMVTERERISTWLADERDPVVKFAEAQIRSLNNAIAAAQQDAEADIAMRKLSYGEQLDDED
ncbi:MAG: RelA/SpoT domain-containing protein [Pseudomonadota bacterium]